MVVQRIQCGECDCNCGRDRSYPSRCENVDEEYSFELEGSFDWRERPIKVTLNWTEKRISPDVAEIWKMSTEISYFNNLAQTRFIQFKLPLWLYTVDWTDWSLVAAAWRETGHSRNLSSRVLWTCERVDWRKLLVVAILAPTVVVYDCIDFAFDFNPIMKVLRFCKY